MKTKILLVLFLSWSFCLRLEAQYSFKNMKRSLVEKSAEEKYDKQEIQKTIDSLASIGQLKSEDVIKILDKKYGYDNITKGISENAKNDIKKYPWLFPAFVKGSEKQSEISSYFFEGNEKNQKFFQNNNVLYNPTLKSMTLNSEIVNDYFGAFRVGVGFQLNSTVENDNLSAGEIDRNKLVSSLQNGGGNIFINIKFPLLAVGYNENSLGLKSYIYHNTGFELTKFNQADNDFMMTNMTGIVIGGYGNGYQKKMSAFVEAKAALIYGNSKFRNILSVDENINNVIPMTHFVIGVNFSDLYTLRVDMYPFGSYVKNNFPTTISFIITPNNGKK
ncbi:hypothetical protein [Chryseobacterium joostei]|uniref:hypothetical protein n=1 Tax=Chryseobacterium joostei TaxID=112234 RepID=UPI003D1096C3